MNNKNIIIFFILGILLTFGFLFLVHQLINKPNTSKVYPELTQLRANDYWKWSPEKKNVLIEYSDFQCPACKNFHQILKTLEATDSPHFEITKKITFVYRHFPLPQHTNALIAAYAAEAAGRQGKFFQMSDLIFEKQEEWSSDKNPKNYFLNLAKQLKLNLEKFQKDIDSKEIKEKVQDNFLSGQKAEINAVPTFFLNGKKLEITSFEQFKNLLKNL